MKKLFIVSEYENLEEVLKNFPCNVKGYYEEHISYGLYAFKMLVRKPIAYIHTVDASNCEVYIADEKGEQVMSPNLIFIEKKEVKIKY